MSEEQVIPYEPPVITTYGSIVDLTQAQAGAPNSDALCAGNNTPQGVPSAVVCKKVP
jgi:hypothetical protein